MSDVLNKSRAFPFQTVGYNRPQFNSGFGSFNFNGNLQNNPNNKGNAAVVADTNPNVKNKKGVMKSTALGALAGGIVSLML